MNWTGLAQCVRHRCFHGVHWTKPTLISSPPANSGLALAIDIERSRTDVNPNCSVVAKTLKAVHTMMYPRRKTAAGTYGALRSSRLRLIVANIITIGVAE